MSCLKVTQGRPRVVGFKEETVRSQNQAPASVFHSLLEGERENEQIDRAVADPDSVRNFLLSCVLLRPDLGG
ncbi:hypothetical protein chiPu_0026239, partial [Chiloscyllium punctatum]|nr:hypothetical protein [Chiloscyllium punctatum]